METLNAFTQCEIIDMSLFPCCWTVIVEDRPTDHPEKPARGQEGGTCNSSGYVHSFPLGRWCSTMAYHNILISWSPEQGAIRMWRSLASLIVGLPCETVYTWGREANTGKEENKICAQVPVWYATGRHTQNSQTQRCSGSHNEEERSGVYHMVKFSASSMGSGFSLGTLDIPAVAYSSRPHHKILLPAQWCSVSNSQWTCTPCTYQKFNLQFYPGFRVRHCIST